ncbi:MAG: hypothetical protein AUK28_04915 [Desulfobacterales bacterium CG2_30_60_27]|nr:MAG: hypothetical protein AUK28_04915 [Desulfobacterales bacterium CG2_30_60_27]
MQETPSLQDNYRVLELLRSIDKFKPFSEDDLQALLRLGRLRKFDADEIIIREGEDDSWIYFLLTGSAAVMKHQKRVRTFNRSGDIFGEMSILDGQPRSATIRATKVTLLLGVDGSLINSKYKENNLAFCYTLYRLFAEVLAERLRLTTAENVELHRQLQHHQSGR